MTAVDPGTVILARSKEIWQCAVCGGGGSLGQHHRQHAISSLICLRRSVPPRPAPFLSCRAPMLKWKRHPARSAEALVDRASRPLRLVATARSNRDSPVADDPALLAVLEALAARISYPFAFVFFPSMHTTASTSTVCVLLSIYARWPRFLPLPSVHSIVFSLSLATLSHSRRELVSYGSSRVRGEGDLDLSIMLRTCGACDTRFDPFATDSTPVTTSPRFSTSGKEYDTYAHRVRLRTRMQDAITHLLVIALNTVG